MTATDRDHRARFWVALALGWLVMAFGAVQLFETKDGVAGAAMITGWVAGGHAVHDLVVVPLTFLVGAVVAAVVAPHLRAPIRAGLLASACVVAVGYPALRGFGRKPNNPSVLPLDYGTAVLTALVTVWVLVIVWLAAAGLWRRRARPDTRVPSE